MDFIWLASSPATTLLGPTILAHGCWQKPACGYVAATLDVVLVLNAIRRPERVAMGLGLSVSLWSDRFLPLAGSCTIAFAMARPRRHRRRQLTSMISSSFVGFWRRFLGFPLFAMRRLTCVALRSFQSEQEAGGQAADDEI